MRGYYPYFDQSKENKVGTTLIRHAPQAARATFPLKKGEGMVRKAIRAVTRKASMQPRLCAGKRGRTMERSTRIARVLRKHMTKQERKLWYEFLREFPYPVYRQKVIGSFIVDFYCAKAKVVIELDGSQHYQGKQAEQDAVRDEMLQELGICVLRFPNNAVQDDFAGVCEQIARVCRYRAGQG